MALPNRSYLSDLINRLRAQWPNNRAIHIVCHGHSVPAGYFATPMVDSFNAYPHLLHQGIKHRFPYAVVNVIVTAIGGENSQAGAARFEAEVLCHRPDVVTIDYALNDRGIGLEAARKSWISMIQAAQQRGAKVLLLTGTPDNTLRQPSPDAQRGQQLRQHAEQIRALAGEYQVGLVDTLAAFDRYFQDGGDLADVLSWPNHPNRAGHEIVAKELLRWFPAE